jgi:Fe2+ or Zn2+ uptake regulation protein
VRVSVCGRPGCRTILTRYNDSGFCFAHAPEPTLEYNGHKFFICGNCGDVCEQRKDFGGVCGLCHRYPDRMKVTS